MRATSDGILRWLVNLGIGGSLKVTALGGWLIHWLLLYCQVKLEHILNRLADVGLRLDHIHWLLLLAPTDLIVLPRFIEIVRSILLFWMKRHNWTLAQLHDFLHFIVLAFKNSHLRIKKCFLCLLGLCKKRILVLLWGVIDYNPLLLILWMWIGPLGHFRYLLKK